jgi:Zn-finger nucleic acid-binding protein
MPALIQVCRCPKCETIVKLTRSELQKMWTRVLLEWPGLLSSSSSSEAMVEQPQTHLRYREQ